MPTKKQIERKSISDAQLTNEYLKLFEIGNTDNTNIYEHLRTTFKLAKERHVKFYHKTLNEWKITKENATNEQIHANQKESLKSGLKLKIAHQIELQNEIKELQGVLKAGYIAKKITINGKLHEKTEILGSYEISSIHRIIDEKRKELFKLDGMYAPTKQAQTDVHGNDLKDRPDWLQYERPN
jgi:hypothetical protein